MFDSKSSEVCIVSNKRLLSITHKHGLQSGNLPSYFTEEKNLAGFENFDTNCFLYVVHFHMQGCKLLEFWTIFFNRNRFVHLLFLLLYENYRICFFCERVLENEDFSSTSLNSQSSTLVPSSSSNSSNEQTKKEN